MLGELTDKNKQRKEFEQLLLMHSNTILNCSREIFVPNQVKFTHTICLSVTAGVDLFTVVLTDTKFPGAKACHISLGLS